MLLNNIKTILQKTNIVTQLATTNCVIIIILVYFFTYLFTLVCMDINWHLYGEAHLPPGIWPEPCLIMRTRTVTWTSVYDASRDMVTDFTFYEGVMDGRTNTWWQPKDTLTMSEIINRHSVLNTPSKIDVVASFVEPYGWTIRVIGEESLILVHSPGIYDRGHSISLFPRTHMYSDLVRIDQSSNHHQWGRAYSPAILKP